MFALWAVNFLPWLVIAIIAAIVLGLIPVYLRGGGNPSGTTSMTTSYSNFASVPISTAGRQIFGRGIYTCLTGTTNTTAFENYLTPLIQNQFSGYNTSLAYSYTCSSSAIAVSLAVTIYSSVYGINPGTLSSDITGMSGIVTGVPTSSLPVPPSGYTASTPSFSSCSAIISGESYVTGSSTDYKYPGTTSFTCSSGFSSSSGVYTSTSSSTSPTLTTPASLTTQAQASGTGSGRLANEIEW